MKIAEFIQQEIVRKRLDDHRTLVVYDAERRYRELCLALAGDACRVIDASESSIESREAALAALQEMGASAHAAVKQLLIYVPAPAPITDEQKQRDPFSIYAEMGGCFPDPLHSGDEYKELCIKFKPDHATTLRKLFAENPAPAFAVIDAVGGGAGWPQLQAMLQVDSARDILFALLVPSETQRGALKGQEGWVAEAKHLLKTTLDLRLITRAKSWEAIGDELWRYLLFSEFVFDLPAALPASLANAPRAPEAARALVEDLCDRLRSDVRTQELYITRAETIEGPEVLNLPVHCRAIVDLGVRDTFPFEERSFFARAVTALRAEDMDALRALVSRHGRSIWVSRGESQAQWQLLLAAVALVAACDDADRQLLDRMRSVDALIDFYVGSLREVDRLQRELEQASGDAALIRLRADGDDLLDPIISHARARYRRLIDRVQPAFVSQVEAAGWPPPGRLANADVFDKFVAPRLQESGRRVAVILVDALRFELGVELQKQLATEGQVDLAPACAQLPTITPVGMASLLPHAGRDLVLTRRDDKLLPVLDGQPLPTVVQRLDVLRKRYGQRVADVPLREFVRGKAEPAKTVELLVLRSNEMDQAFEANPETAPGQIRQTLQQVQAAVRKLRASGFHAVLVLTDHGFYLNPVIEAGDACARPPGKWLQLHGRILLGEGSADGANFVMAAPALGVRGDFAQVAGPRGMVAYQGGMSYFHGGLSLQEAIVPVLVVRLRAAEAAVGKPAYTVTLRYKRGGKRVTTMRPVFEVAVDADSLFPDEAPVEILLEAHSPDARIVGEALHSAPVNPATGTLALRPGERVDVTLRLDESYEGKLVVTALNPTTLTGYPNCRVEMETDYTR